MSQAPDALRADEYRAALQSAPDAMLVVDGDGRILFVNAETTRMFGYDADELIGRPVELLLPERFRHEHVAQRRSYQAVPRTRPMGVGLDLSGRRKDGSEFPLEISLSPMRTERGVFVTAAIRDISDRKRAEAEREQLSRARAEAEAASKAKDDFLATLSHELRAPLQAIVGWTQILQTRGDDPTVRRAAETIARNVRAQSRLVSDLLDISRIISGKLALEPSPVSLIPLVQRTLDAWRPAAEAKGIALEFRQIGHPPVVMGDAIRLEQVLSNLLSNAVKFTPDGGRVEILLEGAGDQAVIRVTDTGIGIAPEFLPHVFVRFTQADSSMTRRHGGLGIGLALVRHLVELHQGTVRAESAGPGQGTRFSVVLPAMAEAEIGIPEPAEPEPSERPAWLRGVRVLLVDDDPDTRDVVTQMLEGGGAEVITAASAAEALALLARSKPDVLLSDIAMPNGDGYWLIRQVRADRAIPAVALTAYAGGEDRRRALEAGYNAHLAKPVEGPKLLTVLARLAGRSRRSDAA